MHYKRTTGPSMRQLCIVPATLLRLVFLGQSALLTPGRTNSAGIPTPTHRWSGQPTFHEQVYGAVMWPVIYGYMRVASDQLDFCTFRVSSGWLWRLGVVAASEVAVLATARRVDLGVR